MLARLCTPSSYTIGPTVILLLDSVNTSVSGTTANTLKLCIGEGHLLPGQKKQGTLILQCCKIQQKCDQFEVQMNRIIDSGIARWVQSTTICRESHCSMQEDPHLPIQDQAYV